LIFCQKPTLLVGFLELLDWSIFWKIIKS